MTKEEFISALDRIGEISGDNDDVLEILATLSTDRDEMEGREVYGQNDVFDTDGVRWSEKYDNMRRRYRERFFTDEGSVIKDQVEDIEKDDDSTVTDFDELFEERESDYSKE